MSGVFDVSRIDTNPGADTGPFCPPENFSGGPAEYMHMIRIRFTTDRSYAVRFASYARQYRRNFPLEIEGPYAMVARAALRKVIASVFPPSEAIVSEEAPQEVNRRSF